MRILQSSIRVDCVHAESAELLADAWSQCVQDPIGVPERNVLPDVISDEFSPGSYLTAIGNRLTHLALAELDESFLVLEGFGLADREGHVLLVSGVDASMLGPLLELAGTELSYVTQRMLAVGRDGAVVPLPGPITLPPADPEQTWPDVVGPDRLGLNTCPALLRLAAVVLVEPGDEGDGSPGVSRLPFADAVATLALRIVSGSRAQHPIQRVCEAIQQAGGAWTVTGAADHLADALLAALRTSEREDHSWGVPRDRDTNEQAWQLRDGRVRQVPWEDAVTVGDETIASVSGRAMRLGPLGSTIWRGSARGATLEELTVLAEGEHGQHPDAEKLVAEAVRELSRSGAVSRLEPYPLSDVLRGALLRQPGVTATTTSP